MKLRLTRYSYSETETEGWLTVGDQDLWTIEQPWDDIGDGEAFPSGAPFKSCIPEGEYNMIPFTRPNGEKTWVLRNPLLGVFAFASDSDSPTRRFLCLLHKANFVGDVQGCIAPGKSRALLRNVNAGNQYERAVSNSASAMNLLRDTLGELSTGHMLEIIQARGALYGGE
jgi:hypothetical protein